MANPMITGALTVLSVLALASVAHGAVTEVGPKDRKNCKFEIDGVALQGDDADDRIDGTPRNDFIAGGSGDDTIDGDSGRDCLYGQKGDDRVKGGRGADLIKGGKAADRLGGQVGNDVIRGNKGNDRLVDRRGRNRLYCGPGIDTAITNSRSFVARDCENVRRGGGASVTVPPGQSEADQYFETVPDGSGNSSLDSAGRPRDALSKGQIAALEELGEDGVAAAEIAGATAPDGAGTGAPADIAPEGSTAATPAASASSSSEGLGSWLWVIVIGTVLAVATFVAVRWRRSAGL